MGVISSILIFLFFVLSYYLNSKDKIDYDISLCTEFIAYWFIIVFAGCFHFFGLYDISTTVYVLVIVGIISFFFGYRFFRLPLPKKHNYFDDIKRIEYIKLSKFFYIILFVAIIIIIKQILLLLPIIIARGMFAARAEFAVDETLFLSPQLSILLAYFAKPFVKASIIIMIVNAVRTKFTKKNIVMVLSITMIYFFSEGGRAIIMDVFFVLSYVIYINRHIIAKKTKNRMNKTVLVIALLPIAVTLERGSDIIGSIYTYYCGSLQFLSQAINLKGDFFDDNLWGIASFQGFIKPITGILQVLGIDKPEVVQEASDFIIDAQYTVYDISPNYDMNYFYTTYGYSYKDAGIFGVILIHFIFGILCKVVDIKQVVSRESVRWLAIKATFFYCVLYTMSYFPFAMYLHAMTLIYIYIITSKIFSRKRTIIIRPIN